jgi:hypothetical protein
MIKIKRINSVKKGFSLVEALVSSTILLIMVSLLTRMLYNFNYTSTINMMKSEMDMDLRKTVERLEREISPAKNVLPDQTVNGYHFVTSNAEIAFQIPSYDIDNYPLYEPTGGHPQLDLVGIRMGEGTEIVSIQDPVTKTISSQKVKKLIFSIEPVPDSRRKLISNQAIFEYYIPIDSDPTSPTLGTYKSNTGGQVLKLFSYYGENNVEITDITKFPQARTIKIVLLAQKTYGSSFMTAKRETEIRLRNSTY